MTGGAWFVLIVGILFLAGGIYSLVKLRNPEPEDPDFRAREKIHTAAFLATGAFAIMFSILSAILNDS